MDGTLRAGVVGVGGLGTHLGEAIEASATGTVAAVADVDETARERAGSAFDVPPGRVLGSTSGCSTRPTSTRS